MLEVASLGDLGDETMAAAGRRALARVVATLPDRKARPAAHAIMRSWRPPEPRAVLAVDLDLLRTACWDEFSVRIAYRDANGRRTECQTLRLGMSYSPRTLMLIGWCLLREAHRTFEMFRIEAIERGEHSFRPRRVQFLREYVALRTAEWKRKEQQANHRNEKTQRGAHLSPPFFTRTVRLRSKFRPIVLHHGKRGIAGSTCGCCSSDLPAGTDSPFLKFMYGRQSRATIGNLETPYLAGQLVRLRR